MSKNSVHAETVTSYGEFIESFITNYNSILNNQKPVATQYDDSLNEIKRKTLPKSGIYPATPQILSTSYLNNIEVQQNTIINAMQQTKIEYDKLTEELTRARLLFDEEEKKGVK